VLNRHLVLSSLSDQHFKYERKVEMVKEGLKRERLVPILNKKLFRLRCISKCHIMF
uniref:Uncharacterized protein n=1 Tax=Lynx canadensis TaxID=61383 RepID=A0A667HN81_LYNCA